MRDSYEDTSSVRESKKFPASLPWSARLFFLLSSFFLITAEGVCVVRFVTLHRHHMHIPVVQYGLLIMLILPWFHGLIGLLAAGRFANRRDDSIEIEGVMLSLAFVPFWCYLLFLFASEFFR